MIVKVDLNNSGYDIIIEDNILKNIGEIILPLTKGKNIFIVTDDNVEPIYYSCVEQSLSNKNFNVHKLILPCGETSKNINNLQLIYKELISSNIKRNDLIIALGGGVIGDITGFAASTYLRGVPFVNIPTTLLAQVDSSVGGKTAINLENGKNLVGTFYQPMLVVIDPYVLNTLDDRIFYDGMSEVIKYGCIKSNSLFNKLLDYKTREIIMQNIKEIICECVSIKRDIVQLDEKDEGLRNILNFGHTIGHAIENYYGYVTYTHGEGVAIGMNYISQIGEQLGITELGTACQIVTLLKQYNLPTEVPKIDLLELIDIIKYDKKSSDNHINAIFIKKIGSSLIKPTTINEIKAILA